MKIRLLVDSISLLSPLTGIGRYTYEISRLLEKENNLNVEYFYGYYSKKLLETSSGMKKKRLKSYILKNPLFKKIVRKLLFTSSKIFAPHYDVYWQPNFIPNSGIKARKTVTSIHDFSFILYRDFHPKERIEYIEKYFFKNIVRSDLIITGSQYTKNEILQRLNFQEKKVKVIYHGVNHDVFNIKKDLLIDFIIPSKFILSVGSIEPRKNLLGFLKAYNSLGENIKKEYKLVLVGFKGWNNKEIMDIINKDETYIHYLGFVSDEVLAKVYNLASLFIFPSFYEGFGLPPLEAMACGTPVIASNLTSIPEVCGDAAVYINPHDVGDIRDKIEMVLKDEVLQAVMIRKGLEQAKKFTWEKAAREHMKVFNKVVEN